MITKISRRLLIGLSFIICHLSFSMMFTSCAEDDDNGPANIGLGIKVFFPTKVVTNQPVTINGSGFTDVTEIEFPGGAKAASFEIVSDDMIRVVTPSGVAADGGKILVRTASGQAESRLPLTVGHTQVSGFSKQPGETASGGEQITVFGSDLEFITGVELLNADSVPQVIDHKDFYRKGTSTIIFSVPQKDIYEGTFTGVLHTYDGQRILMPELAYEPAADEGHWETVKTTVWKNDGSLGEINWSSDYRFAPASNSTGEECYTVPQDVWERLKTETFYVTIKGASPQIRVTSGWWSTTWTGDDIFPGNERLADNGDGTFTLTVNLAGDPLLDVLDAQHLLFTGSGYVVEEIYFIEIVSGGGGNKPSEVVIWQGDGSAGAVSWSSTYRFANAEHVTGEEIYAIPMDQWEAIRTSTFYLDLQAEDPQIRVTTGWWSTTWTGADFQPGTSDLLKNNGDGTWTLEINFSGDPILDALDVEHLLFTGDRFTPTKLYYYE